MGGRWWSIDREGEKTLSRSCHYISIKSSRRQSLIIGELSSRARRQRLIRNVQISHNGPHSRSRAYYPSKDIKEPCFLPLLPFLISLDQWLNIESGLRKNCVLWILRKMKTGNGKHPDRRDVLVACAKRKFATRHFRANRALFNPLTYRRL